MRFTTQHHFLEIQILFLHIMSIVTGRVSERIHLPSPSPGTSTSIVVHKWGRPGSKRVYIQASLHADEIPGMLVTNHLVKMLDCAEAKGDIMEEVVLVPFANPIGLDQQVMDKHIGRFSLETGVNFNRDIPGSIVSVASDTLILLRVKSRVMFFVS